MDSEDIRSAAARHLAVDRMLGARFAPLHVSIKTTASKPAESARQNPAIPPPPTQIPESRSLARASATPANTGKAVGLLQTISPAELARREKELRTLDESQVKTCRKCILCETRKQTVFGQGHAGARLVFVGEGPGADEDEQGLAFVGRAGQLLTKMIEAMGFTRDQVYICNIVKCRPPDNRVPAPDESAACWPYLDAQLRIIAPEVIVALGKSAAQTLLRTTEAIGRLRGTWREYYTSGMPGLGSATRLMPTFHPAYLLRSPNEKGKAWSDLKMVLQELGLPVPPK